MGEGGEEQGLGGRGDKGEGLRYEAMQFSGQLSPKKKNMCRRHIQNIDFDYK